MSPTLYLIPVPIEETTLDRVLPKYNSEIISTIKYFIVENIRSARRFLKKNDPTTDIDSLTFFELNTHSSNEDISNYILPMNEGHNIGIISEAGCPAVADPGAVVVGMAQKAGFKVVPLVGPSSILLALMGSGFNGQSFAFNGYLPIEQDKRIKSIKKLEIRSQEEDQTQIFIETPYRNEKLAEDIIKTCSANTFLCIAMNISSDQEYIITKKVSEWKNKLPQMHKQPAVFLIYSQREVLKKRK